MTTVKNLNGTSDNTCSCGSWLQHWKNFAEDDVLFCSVDNCYEHAEVGGHVQNANSIDQAWYIVPLCKSCNKRSSDDPFSVNEKLVPANRSETCDRKRNHLKDW